MDAITLSETNLKKTNPIGTQTLIPTQILVSFLFGKKVSWCPSYFHPKPHWPSCINLYQEPNWPMSRPNRPIWFYMGQSDSGWRSIWLPPPPNLISDRYERKIQNHHQFIKSLHFLLQLSDKKMNNSLSELFLFCHFCFLTDKLWLFYNSTGCLFRLQDVSHWHIMQTLQLQILWH